ncbi:Holliday junction branch migration protein RuvA [Candidatus Gracilibacteria bacterium]|nr:Holliday junction branch migration protein RuvA [Candidatus Gracilibacteria bacterium]
MYSFFLGKPVALQGIALTLLIDGTGIGYEIFISPILIANIRIGQNIEVWIHHHKTDVSESLFGFIDLDERTLFRELLKVNGVGGKTALNMLGLGRENLIRAIQLEDDKLLSSVPGIGKKTAQKIIVDLKGSIDFSAKSGSPVVQKNTSDMTLISSLIQMGYDKSRVEEVVSLLDSTLPLEIRTVEAIRALSK